MAGSAAGRLVVAINRPGCLGAAAPVNSLLVSLILLWAFVEARSRVGTAAKPLTAPNARVMGSDIGDKQEFLK